MRAMSAWATGNTLHLPLGRLALCLDCETCFEVGSMRVPPAAAGCGPRWRDFSTGDMTHD
jgi:hypothetical protein